MGLKKILSNYEEDIFKKLKYWCRIIIMCFSCCKEL